jgi:hypothetical protein
MNEQINKDSKMIADFCSQLKSANDLDTIVIVATKRDIEGSTYMVSASCGNFYGCIGSVEEWLDRQSFVGEKQ